MFQCVLKLDFIFKSVVNHLWSLVLVSQFLFSAVIGSDINLLVAVNGGVELKPGVAFHLYISSAPCGDARQDTSGIYQYRARRSLHVTVFAVTDVLFYPLFFNAITS
jgi:Adenosine-deaminase (editase) domain